MSSIRANKSFNISDFQEACLLSHSLFTFLIEKTLKGGIRKEGDNRPVGGRSGQTHF